MTLLRRRWQEFLEFLFPPETDRWLAVFRIGLGLQVLVYSLFLRSDWHHLFATTGKGLVGRELGEAISSFDSPLIPKLGWLVSFGRHIGISEETALSVAWACLLCMGCCLLLGLRHGGYCVGCCWVLMALLFVVGVMNVLWIALLALLVLLEKLTPVGRWIARAAGIACVAAGAWLLVSLPR